MNEAKERGSQSPRRRRRLQSQRWLIAAGVLVLIGGGGFAYANLMSAPSFTLIAGDAQGLQPGDLVMRDGVVVGRVVKVEAAERGSEIRFELQKAQEIFADDVVRVRRPFLSATSEIRIVRGCRPQAAAIDPGSTLRDGATLADLSTRARCSTVGQALLNWLVEVDAAGAVKSVREAVGSALSSAGWDDQASREQFISTLRFEGAGLVDRLRQQGEDDRADSISRELSRLEGGE